jgi:predicted metal-dependent hydrolase
MTDLQVRKVKFDFDGDVPFLWNPSNPAFSLQLNAVSVIAVCFEKFIVAAVRQALPLISDPEVKAEGDAFLRQEAQHASCHREHLRALVRRYPGLQETIDEAVASYDRLTATKSLAYRLAYIADLEATFTPYFKMLLDHDDALFQPGDDRVASLFLWHFVEEIEHRASGLVLYRAMVPNRWYRTLVLPSVARHVLQVTAAIANGFNEHVPWEDRQIDARVLDSAYGIKQALKQLPLVGDGSPPEPRPDFYAGVPTKDRRTSGRRILMTQTPYHDPEHQPRPEFARGWFAQFDADADVAHWYAAAAAQ